MKVFATVFLLQVVVQGNFSRTPRCSNVFEGSPLTLYRRTAAEGEILVEATTSVQLICILPNDYRIASHQPVRKVVWERVRKEHNVSITNRFDKTDTNARVEINQINDTAVQFLLHDAWTDDSGEYRCISNDANGGRYLLFGAEVCSITVTVENGVRKDGHCELIVSALDNYGCDVNWSTYFPNDSADLIHRVRYRKAGSGDDWTIISNATRDHGQHLELRELDAGATYEIQVGTSMANTEDWSYHSQAACKTPGIVPGGPPGVFPGAFEQRDFGGMRTVTLYWKGVPKNKRNGRDFGYKVSTWLDGESYDRRKSGDAFKPSSSNIVLYRLPSDVAVNVEIVQYNKMGNAPPEMVERVRIPAVQNPPLIVDNVRILNFSATELEISWSVNRNASAFDLYFCPTLLLDLITCTDGMEHRKLSGDQLAVNFTHKSGELFHFAVGARENITDSFGNVSESYSGMVWATQFCSLGEHRGQLNGLSVTPLQNGSVHIRWTEPCESRYLLISGYQVNYSLCEVGIACSADKMIRTNATSVAVAGLKENSRYCFVVEVLLDSSTNITFVPAPECVVTRAAEYSFPAGAVAGIVAGVILLIVVIIVLKKVVKGLRK